MAQQEGRLAKRYARALLDLYPPTELDAISGALATVAATWRENPELREVISNPGISFEQRSEAIKEIVRRIRPEDVTISNFILLLLENGRIGHISSIAEAFRAMVDELKKILALHITSAFDVSDDERIGIQGRIAQEFGTLSTVSWKTDASLLGGLSIRSGDTVLDGTVKGELHRIKGELTA